jgi:hypothetical protein
MKFGKLKEKLIDTYTHETSISVQLLGNVEHSRDSAPLIPGDIYTPCRFGKIEHILPKSPLAFHVNTTYLTSIRSTPENFILRLSSA